MCGTQHRAWEECKNLHTVLQINYCKLITERKLRLNLFEKKKKPEKLKAGRNPGCSQLTSCSAPSVLCTDSSHLAISFPFIPVNVEDDQVSGIFVRI